MLFSFYVVMNSAIGRVRTHFVFDFSHGLDSKSVKRLQTRSLKSLARLIFLKQHRTGRDYHPSLPALCMADLDMAARDVYDY